VSHEKENKNSVSEVIKRAEQKDLKQEGKLRILQKSFN
jgi:hypothetical protein